MERKKLDKEISSTRANGSKGSWTALYFPSFSLSFFQAMTQVEYERKALSKDASGSEALMQQARSLRTRINTPTRANSTSRSVSGKCKMRYKALTTWPRLANMEDQQ